MSNWLRDKIGTNWIGTRINSLLGSIEFMIMRLYKEKEFIELINQVKKEDRFFLLKPSEMFIIYSLSRAQRKVKGAYAEVGVYRGASSRIICEVKEDKELYLFDTFEGIPEINELDTQIFQNQFCVDLEFVKKRLTKFPNVFFYKGVFPKTAGPIKNKKFSFVHLDVDTYQSTKDCLAFFYPRMQKAGIILSHDYAQLKGVKKAFSEFFESKIEEIIELPMSQCMIIKL